MLFFVTSTSAKRTGFRQQWWNIVRDYDTAICLSYSFPVGRVIFSGKCRWSHTQPPFRCDGVQIRRVSVRDQR